MEKSVMGLVAAVGALAPLAGAQAAVVTHEDAARALQVSSVAELLEPVGNSAAILAALGPEVQTHKAPSSDGVKLAWHHHHHHHHWYHHHHHHYYHHHHHHWVWHHHHRCFFTPVGWVCP